MSTKKEKTNEVAFLGIDIGSTTVKLVLIDKDKKYLAEPLYLRSQGEPVKILQKGLKDITNGYDGELKVCITGSGREMLVQQLGLEKDCAITEIYAHARGSFSINSQVRTIIDIGGQDTKMIHLGPGASAEEFSINNFIMNDLCAGGTGAFIELHAKNLGFESAAKFGEEAIKSKKQARISGRCSILALSDVVHYRQTGMPIRDIAAGLCKTIAINVLSMAKGQRLETPVFFQGGVASNKGVAKALKELLKLGESDFIIPTNNDTIGALGAALHAMDLKGGAYIVKEKAIKVLGGGIKLVHSVSSKNTLKKLKKIENENSKIFKIYKYKDNSEFVLGVDIGASSVKLVALDLKKHCFFRFYRLHGGNLIKTLNQGLELLKKKVNGRFPDAVATTGSGRENIGDLIGADFRINEITAQGEGAIMLDSRAETIFEIGGQDSKFIRLAKKQVEDFEMNKVCAAGTGAFIEEVGKIIRGDSRRSFDYFAFGSDSPAQLNHRCSVFAKSDAVAMLNQGITKEDVAAGIAYAGAENYLRLVVGNHETGKEILFLGGLARNCHALVSAMRNMRPDLKIIVPDGGEISGALGTANMALENLKAGKLVKSNFRGFFIRKSSKKIKKTLPAEVSHLDCSAKKCPIKIKNGSPNHCSGCVGFTESSSEVKGKNFVAAYLELIRTYEKKFASPGIKGRSPIGIPRALIYYYQGPLWTAFLGSLGLSVVFSENSEDVIQQGNLKAASSEVCLPMKALIGHVDQLSRRGIKNIFFPTLIEFPRQKGFKRCDNCLLIQATVDSSLRTTFADLEFFSPVIRYRGKKYEIRRALKECGRSLGFGEREIGIAIKKSEEAFAEFLQKKEEIGREFLDLTHQGEIGVLMMGHAYNSAPELDMGLTDNFTRLGVNVAPLIVLPFEESEKLSPQKDINLIARSAQDFYLGARYLVEKEPTIFPLVTNNFLCRPDSISVPIVKKIMKDRPMMHLTVDDNSAKAGFETRCLAFFEVIKNYLESGKKKSKKIKHHPFYYFRPDKKYRHIKGVVWLLPTFRFYAGGFNSIGIKTKLLSDGSSDFIRVGRKYFPIVEPCLPFVQASGALEKLIKSGKFDSEKDYFCIPGTRQCASASLSYVFREVADALNFKMNIISPREGLDITEMIDIFGAKFSLNLVRCLFADEYLKKLHLSIRPYEKKVGEADKVFSDCREELYASFEKGGVSRFYMTLKKCVKKITSVPTIDERDKPKILVTGSYYERSEAFLNDDIYRKIEKQGGEVVRTSLFTDYIEYMLRVRYKNLWKNRDYLRAIRDMVALPVAIFEIGQIKKIFRPFISQQLEPNPVEYFEKMSDIVNCHLDANIILQIYQSYWNMEKGEIEGMLNIHPFNCCTSTAVEPILRKQFADKIPYLTLSFDGQSTVHQDNRLSAFMECIFANRDKINPSE